MAPTAPAATPDHGTPVAGPRIADPPLPRSTRILYGFGAVAYGVKDNGFSVLLLVFYNQVVGLSPDQVGLAVLIALVADAFIDPMIGVLSDNTRSRWGRRHPFMYGCIVPVALSYLLLWNPPVDASDTVKFWYLVGIAFAVRASISCFEVTSAALMPELTRDYDERTRISAWRSLFGWAGGLGLLAVTFAVLLVPTAEYPVGQANADGYRSYAIIGSALMAVSVLVAALGTHHRIPLLPKPPAQQRSASAALFNMLRTYRNRAFGMLMAGGIFNFSLQGIGFALFPYLFTFYWGFSNTQLQFYFLTLFLSALTAFAIAPRLSQRRGKRGAISLFVLLAGTIQATPYLLDQAGLFPAHDAAFFLPMLLAILGCGTACGIAAMVISGAMMSDVVEDSQLRTGERSEGQFFAGSFFMQKCVSGLGIYMSGMVLWFAGFPANAVPGQLAESVTDRLGLSFAVLAILLATCASFIFSRHPHGRGDHEKRLAALALQGDRAVAQPGNTIAPEGLELPRAI